MQHTTTTLANGKIVLAMIDERLSIEEWRQVSLQIQDLVEKAGDTVHVIVDMRQTKSHPMNALQISKVTIWAKNPKIITVNHITESRITSILGEVVIGLVAHTYKSMVTLEQAFQRIIEADETVTASVEELTLEIS